MCRLGLPEVLVLGSVVSKPAPYVSVSRTIGDWTLWGIYRHVPVRKWVRHGECMSDECGCRACDMYTEMEVVCLCWSKLACALDVEGCEGLPTAVKTVWPVCIFPFNWSPSLLGNISQAVLQYTVKIEPYWYHAFLGLKAVSSGRGYQHSGGITFQSTSTC